MSTQFRPLPPDQYPARWLAVAEAALASPGEGVSVTATPTANAANSRMCRLRAFRDGLALFPGASPSITRALNSGLVLGFRKVYLHGMWDVQMRATNPGEGIRWEILE